MKKFKYIYVVSLKDNENNDLYLAPTGKITSDFISWDYQPDVDEVINLIDNDNIISFEIVKANSFMAKVIWKGYKKEM